MQFTLGKEQKLKSKKSIETLFSSGKKLRNGPVQIVYQIQKETHHNKIGFIVSKRFFKKAPDRNRIKRLLREAYRLQQHNITVVQEHHLEMMLIYQSPKIPDQKQVSLWIQKLLEKLNTTISTQSNSS